MALAVVIFALVVGSVIFHFASPWWFTDIISNWQSIDTTILKKLIGFKQLFRNQLVERI
jgi:hypothetical protein